MEIVFAFAACFFALAVFPYGLGLKHGKESVRCCCRRENDFWKAHVPCTNEQQTPENGLIAGFCVRCRTPWPCDYSPERTRHR